MLKTLIAIAASAFALSTQARGQASTRPALIEDVKVTPENGGINPDAFAYKIEGRILAGSNPCQARGVTVSVQQKKVRGIVHVIPQLKSPRSAPRICTREWNPVYKPVKITIRGLHSKIEDVVIHNIGQLGAATSVKDIVADGQTVSLSGRLERVMAIGGETTGIIIILDDGSQVEVDLATNNLDRSLADDLDTLTFKITGTLKTIYGVEIPSRQVLVAETLEPL